MKKYKFIVAFICVLTIFFTISIPAFAINFSAEEAYDAVFVITSGNSLGSGFCIGKNCIITNAHVIDDENDISLSTYQGDIYPAELVAIDYNKDIAILAINEKNLPYFEVVCSKDIDVGDDVCAIGAPKSMAYTLTKGVISAKERKIGVYSYIQTDAAINEGNSGGPLLTDDGRVVGVNTLKMLDSEGIGLAIPMDDVIEFIKSVGIAVDKSGNVSEFISVENIEGYTIGDPDDITDEDTENNENNKRNNENKNDEEHKMLFISISFVVSFVMNIILLVVLCTKKSKTKVVKLDKSERTDFEIEFLE